MHDAHKAGDEARFLVTRREAKVLGHATAEWVRRLIEPAVLKIEPCQGHQFEAERLLPLWRKGTPRLHGFRAAGLPFEHRGKQRRQFAFKPREDRLRSEERRVGKGSGYGRA